MKLAVPTNTLGGHILCPNIFSVPTRRAILKKRRHKCHKNKIKPIISVLCEIRTYYGFIIEQKSYK